MRHFLRSTCLLAGAGLAILAACGGDSTGPGARTVTTVTVTPATFSLYAGATRTLTATAADQGDSVMADATFTWSSSTPSVATISASGLVTAVGVGVDTLRATSDGVIGEAILTVSLVPVDTVVVTPPSATIHPTQTSQLAASTRDSAGSVLAGRPVTWTTSTPSVATVSVSGLVTAVGVGVDTIRVTSEGVVGEAVITVSLALVDTVVVTPASATIHLTQTRQLSASARDSVGAVAVGYPVTWASSDSAKAAVSVGGLVTAVAVGTVTITATAGGHQGVSTVTVDSNSVATVQLVPAGDTVQVGDTLSPVAVPRDSSGNVMVGLATTWGVNDSSTLQPIAGEKFVVLANGAVTLSATIQGVTKTGTVLAATCGDTLQVAAGSFNFPLIAGGLATDASGVVDIGGFKGNAAWYGGGMMYGTDSAHMVVAYDPSLNLPRGVSKGGNCLVSAGPPYHRAYSKVKPLAGLPGPAGLRVVQESFVNSSTSADSGFTLFRYTFTNTSGTAIVGLRAGYIIDWDLGNDPGSNVLTFRAADGVHAAVESDSVGHTERLGVIGLNATGIGTSRGWLNGADPSTRGGYYGILASGTSTATSGPMDVRALAGIPAVTVPAYGRVVVYFAIVGGTTSAKFTTSLNAAKALATSLGYN